MSSFQLVSLTNPSPVGFQFDPSPSLRSLRRLPFCLYTSNPRLYEELIAPVQDQVTGILAVNDGSVSWTNSGRYLYRLGVPEPEMCWLSSWARLLLGMLEQLRANDDKADALGLEAARVLEDRQRLTSEHAEFRASILREMGDRKRAEQALRESEEKYRVLAGNASDIIWSIDLDLHFTYVSPSAERIQQWTQDEWRSLSVKDVVTPDAWQTISAILTEEFAWEGSEGADPNRSRTFEVQEYRKDGSTFWAEVRASFLRAADGRPIGIMGITRDISDRKRAEAEKERLEAQLLQAQRIESVGRLAGGVAHELNNMLTPILGYGDMLSHDLSMEDPRRTMAEQIVLCAQRCRDLVSQLLAFARKQPLETKPINLKEVIVAFERMLRRTLRENVRIEFNLAPVTGLILGDRNQLEQAILKLAVNAQDAMPQGGVLRIATADVVLESDHWGEDAVEAGPYVMVLVSDTGEGMDHDTLKRVFDPFFTTKEIGRGTGLGLSMVYGVVRQHGGHIRVSSDLGNGTTFRLYFPRHGRAQPEISPTSGAERAEGGSETVLVVEDEEQVRKLAVKVLKRYGYRVIAAADGLSALEMLSTYEGPLHLLVTDVVLPSMNGKQLWERIQGARRAMKVVYMSGYPADVVGRHGVLEAGMNYIQKPFSIRDFADKVREVLDSD